MKFQTYHYRRYNGIVAPMSWLRLEGLTRLVDPRGGMTVVEIYDDEGNLLDDGVSHCSDLDNYNKKLGRLIATGRALKRLEAHSA